MTKYKKRGIEMNESGKLYSRFSRFLLNCRGGLKGEGVALYWVNMSQPGGGGGWRAISGENYPTPGQVMPGGDF